MIKPAIYLFSLLALLASNDQDNKSSVTRDKAIKISVDLNKIVSLCTLYPKVHITKIIPLETTKEGLMGQIDKIILSNNRYYIADGLLNELFCFDFSGKFMYNIDKKGQGPREYINFSDFSISKIDNRIFLLDNYRSTPTVLIFNDNGFFIKKSKIDVDYSETKKIQILDDSTYLLLATDIKGNKLCSFINNKGEETNTALEKTPQILYRLEYTNNHDFDINKTESGFYMSVPFDNSIYKLNPNKSLSVSYYFDFGKYNLTEQFFEENKKLSPPQFANSLEKSKYCNIVKKIDAADFVYCCAEYSRQENPISIFYNKKNKGISVCTVNKESLGLFVLLDNATYISKNELVTVIYPSQILEITDKIKTDKFFNEIKNYIESEEQNPILVHFIIDL